MLGMYIFLGVCLAIETFLFVLIVRGLSKGGEE